MSVTIELLSKDEYITKLKKSRSESSLKYSCMRWLDTLPDRRCEVASVRLNSNKESMQKFVDSLQSAINGGDEKFEIGEYEHDVAVYVTREITLTPEEFERFLDHEYHDYLKNETWCIHSSMPNGIHPQTHERFAEIEG